MIDAVTMRCGVTPAQIDECLTKGSAPIREGVSIRVSGKRILGQIEISPDVLWRGDEIRAVGVSVPDSVMSAIAGRKVEDAVQSPLLEGGGTITSAKANTLRKRARLNLRVRPAMVPVPTNTRPTSETA